MDTCTAIKYKANDWSHFEPLVSSLLSILLLVYYVVPITYIILNRHNATIKTRSPKMIVTGMTFLCLESVVKTALKSLQPEDRKYWICQLGVFTESIPLLGAMICYILRMRRIDKFFNLYK